jgi:hypothetical protein
MWPEQKYGRKRPPPVNVGAVERFGWPPIIIVPLTKDDFPLYTYIGIRPGNATIKPETASGQQRASAIIPSLSGGK